MMFGGDVPEANGKSRPMKREDADAYGMLLLAYVAENPQVSIVNAYDTIRKEVGIRPVAEAAAGAAAKAKTEAANAAKEKAPNPWAPAGEDVRLRQTNQEKIRQALRQGPAIVPGVPSVDASMYEALATGPSVAGKVGLLPGAKPVSLVQEEVKKALVPVTQAITAAAWKAFWDLTPEQVLELRSEVEHPFRKGRSVPLSDVSSSAYAKLVKDRVATVKKELSTRGAEQSLALIGDDVLNSAAVALARPLALAIGDMTLARLARASDTSGRTMGGLFSEAEIKRVQDTKGPFSGILSSYLSAGVMHTALSKGEEDPADRAKMVDKLFGESGIRLGGTQAAVEAAPEAARNLARAGITLGDYADTYFGRNLPAANTEPALPAEPPAPAPQKPDPAYVVSARAAYSAAHPKKELDLDRALEAGQAVSDRIRSRPLTETARDALYGQKIRQPFFHQGLGLDELDFYADSLQTAYYAGKVTIDQIPREYTKLLGGALVSKQEKKAKAERKLWEEREKFRITSRDAAAGGLGVVTPDVAPSTDAE
jgi:hypothetical protein